MKFNFPKNYKYRAKLLGFIDYVTGIVDLLVGILLYFILKIIILNISKRIYIFIIVYVPLILFSFFVTDGENIISFIIQIVKFLKRRGVYLYKKY